MNRKQLISELAELDSRLQLQRRQIAVTSRQAATSLQQYNPYWLIAGGLLAGTVVGHLGWRSAWAAGIAGYRLFPLAAGGHAWMSALAESG